MTCCSALSLLTLLLVAAQIAHASVHDLGDGSGFGGGFMERTYSSYSTLPMNETELQAQGWVKNAGACDPAIGWQWLQDDNITVDRPLVLYTTQGGQISGLGVLMTGDPPEPQKKYARQQPKGWQVDIAFRHGDILCSGETSPATIGDTLIVNPWGDTDDTMAIPLTENASNTAGWHRGSCFDGMGWHRYLDTAYRNTSMSWEAQNFFPVAAMVLPLQ